MADGKRVESHLDGNESYPNIRRPYEVNNRVQMMSHTSCLGIDGRGVRKVSEQEEKIRYKATNNASHWIWEGVLALRKEFKY